MTLAAGVDLGGTKIQTAVLRGRNIAGTARTATPQTGASEVVAAIVQTIRDALNAAGGDPGDLRSVGVGSPGSVDSVTGLVSSSPNVPGFEKSFALGPALSGLLPATRVVIDNDVRVAMLGEHQAGAGRRSITCSGSSWGPGSAAGWCWRGLRHGRGPPARSGTVGRTAAGSAGADAGMS